MARMTAAEAAIHVLKKEGVDVTFGLPGAAINPFYAAMRKVGGVDHVLARHVEGASHMAEGYTRTEADNIGVCLGTSGPAGTDMITACTRPAPIPFRFCALPARRRRPSCTRKISRRWIFRRLPAR